MNLTDDIALNELPPDPGGVESEYPDERAKLLAANAAAIDEPAVAVAGVGAGWSIGDAASSATGSSPLT